MGRGGTSARYLAVECGRCGARRVAEQGKKTAQCHRCGKPIDLKGGPALFSSTSLDEVQAYLGERAAKEAGAPSPSKLKPASGRTERARQRSRIAEATGAAEGRANQVKLVLRRGFESFGELTVDDLAAIADEAELGLTGHEIADTAVELGLAGRLKNGSLVPLREGR